jgi:hypothetical protein
MKMKFVYLVQHVHKFNEDDEDVKIIGIYATEQLAQEAVERTKKLAGFSEAVDGFYIDRYELNKDHWTEGYVTEFE